MRVACPSCGREVHQVARHCKHCHAVLGRRDHLDEPAPLATPPPASKLPGVAIAVAGVAAVLLVLAVVWRHGASEPAEQATAGSGSAEGSAEEPMPRTPPSALIDAAVAAMFGAVCRHEVRCGIGTPARCTYVEDTMKQMPKSLAVRPCTRFDEAEARRCIAELATRSCADFAKSLDVLDLQDALDRVRSCRRACR